MRTAANKSNELRAVAAVREEEIDAFRRDGAICIRGLFQPAELDLLRTGIERNLDAPGRNALTASRSGDRGRFFEDFCNWQRIEEYRRFVLQSPAAAVAGRLMCSPFVRLYHDHLLVKEAGTEQRTPWHQDQPYYNIDGTDTCSLWLPVDPVQRASTLEFVAGSHCGPWYMPRTFIDSEAKWFPEGSLVDVPDVDAEPHRHRILGWAIEPGDAVFFHMLTLHAAGGAKALRRVISLRFIGADVVHAPRPWRTSPEFPGLQDELPAGAPMDHPYFPVVWSETADEPQGA